MAPYLLMLFFLLGLNGLVLGKFVAINNDQNVPDERLEVPHFSVEEFSGSQVIPYKVSD